MVQSLSNLKISFRQTHPNIFVEGNISCINNAVAGKLITVNEYACTSRGHEVVGEVVADWLVVQSGARINISDASCPERIVTISGTTQQIVDAFSMISRRFEEVR